MNEKEFLDKHPGLKDKIGYSHTKNVIKQTNILVANLKDIHETQIDKEVIEKAIDVAVDKVELYPYKHMKGLETKAKTEIKKIIKKELKL